MIILQADNRRLTMAAKYTFLTTNYPSATSNISVLNATDTDFAANAFLLFGNFGSEDAEIIRILSVNNSTGAVTLNSNTLFAHSESTRVTILPYNQIRFFWTSTTTFNTSTPLASYLELQPSDWFTTYTDDSQSTGYGWYAFYNSYTATLSQPSNYIPYSGFEPNTTEDLLGDFFSMLSNKELTLVTREDALSWASEGYSRMRNKLNLTNVEYTASTILPLAIVAGTIEYDLPDDFDHLVSIISGIDPLNVGVAQNYTISNIEFIPLRMAYSYTGTAARYYIRGMKIGFIPTPSASATYQYMYLKKAARLTINTDEIDLPNNGFYVVKDWMLYRAYQKFQNPLATSYFKTYTDGLNDMIIAAVKRDAHLDAFRIIPEANV